MLENAGRQKEESLKYGCDIRVFPAKAQLKFVVTNIRTRWHLATVKVNPTENFSSPFLYHCLLLVIKVNALLILCVFLSGEAFRDNFKANKEIGDFV